MLVLLANLCATGMLVGLAWTIQLVHYPLFAAVGAGAWPAYAAGHARRITVLVAPWMALEGVTAVALPWLRPPAVPAWQAWAGAALVGLIWLVTATLLVPLHTRLAAGFDPDVAAKLVSRNWIRTATWTARGVLSLLMVARLVGSS